MIIKFLNFILKKRFPKRNITIEKIGNTYVQVAHDCIDNPEYLLCDRFSFEYVQKLSKKVGGSAIFGYSKDKGPIAFIGVLYKECPITHFCDVFCLGNYDTEEYEFSEYSQDDAKDIGNYLVYGVSGIDKLKGEVNFDKVVVTEDIRYLAKFSFAENSTANMDFLLAGKYNYSLAMQLAISDEFFPIGNCVVFGELESGIHVAILGLFESDKSKVGFFRDVWTFDMPNEPIKETIRFLENKEAMLYDDYIVYGYKYLMGKQYNLNKYFVKVDKTLDARFDFNKNGGSKMKNDIRF